VNRLRKPARQTQLVMPETGPDPAATATDLSSLGRHRAQCPPMRRIPLGSLDVGHGHNCPLRQGAGLLVSCSDFCGYRCTLIRLPGSVLHPVHRAEQPLALRNHLGRLPQIQFIQADWALSISSMKRSISVFRKASISFSRRGTNRVAAPGETHLPNIFATMNIITAPTRPPPPST